MARSVLAKTAVTIGMALSFTAGGATAARPDELTRQLQMTDGAGVLSSQEALRQHEQGARGRAGPAGADGKDGSRMGDWFAEQLQISDGYDPVRERQLSGQTAGTKGRAGPRGAERTGAEDAAAAWLQRELQRSDGSP